MNLKCIVKKQATILKNNKLIDDDFFYPADGVVHTLPPEIVRRSNPNFESQRLSDSLLKQLHGNNVEGVFSGSPQKNGLKPKQFYGNLSQNDLCK